MGMVSIIMLLLVPKVSFVMVQAHGCVKKSHRCIHMQLSEVYWALCPPGTNVHTYNKNPKHLE